ncbi:c-type cytochrome [Flaviflagellibacter deserti]|uniref:C-type cytochrome n=1 Tax=Flaviflagellibacter deserti TaxID=2267266 RepID=A0ABV9YVZ2_9HYPH
MILSVPLLALPLMLVFSQPALADAAAGKEKAAVCTTCHGADGISQLPNAPHLAGQPEVYVVEQLKAYRSGARKNEMMTVIAQPLSDQDIDDLAAWFASIQVTATVP